MSKISRDDVLKLARLARLRLTDEEVEKFSEELSEILSYVEMLNKADTKGLKPTYQVSGLTNVSRKDKIVDYGPSPHELLKNVPSREGDQIKVKRMIG